MAKQCIKANVQGKVQGVFFRKSTQTRALELGLTGYAKNLQDGSVEVLACGPQDGLDQLLAFLQVGPPASEVASVRVESITGESMTGFRTL